MDDLTILFRKLLCNPTVQFLLLIILSTVLLFTGLSIRSLWGSEGRWAEIAREMILSGNYFLPTINGIVYFDKPLLSYWAILPFSLNGTVTEASSRLPSAISGVGVILLTLVIGRRLFGGKTGMVSATLLSTSAMFVLWSRTASAEMLSLFMVWLAFWVFLASDYGRGHTAYIVLLYIVGAVASFCKGPVAPAVIFTSLGFYSSIETLISAKKEGFARATFRKSVSLEFRWIFSWQGLWGMFAGSFIFTLLLLLPVITTGSWESVQLMWRENVLRFFRPFDHIEPPYVYLKYIPLFFTPWVFFLIASFWEINKWEQAKPRRWILLITTAIFIFFTCSGSRRSYYILPILPALAIITGKTIDDWLSGDSFSKKLVVHVAALLTSTLLLLTGIGLLYAYFRIEFPHHISQLALGTTAIVSAIASILFFCRGKLPQGFITLFILIFIVELWGFTVGMAIGESKRTLREFSQKVSTHLKDVNDNKIAIYQVQDSAFIFYLNRKPLTYLGNKKELEQFIIKNPDGFVITNLGIASTPGGLGSYLHKMSPAVVEKSVPTKKDDPLALFALSNQ